MKNKIKEREKREALLLNELTKTQGKPKKENKNFFSFFSILEVLFYFIVKILFYQNKNIKKLKIKNLNQTNLNGS